MADTTMTDSTMTDSTDIRRSRDLVSIYAGMPVPQTSPFIVQKVRLQSICPAMMERTNAAGIAKLENDHIEGVGHLVDWILTDDIDEEAATIDLVRAWLTGDRHEIENFQDCIMMCLLQRAQDEPLASRMSAIEKQEIANTTTRGSPIGDLFIEEWAKLMTDHGDQSLSWGERLSSLDIPTELSQEVMNESDKRRDPATRRNVDNRFRKYPNQSQAMWQTFMVGDGFKLRRPEFQED